MAKIGTGTSNSESKLSAQNTEVDPKKKFAEIRGQYEQSGTNKFVKMLWLGDYGTGKTDGLRTMPKPIHIDSFDPGGTNTLSDLISKGKVLPVTKYEEREPSRPKAYERWDNEFQTLYKSDYFDNIGTYVLDSLTSFAEAVMYAQLKKAGRVGETPRQRDYLVQMNTVQDCINLITSLPCHVVVVSHLDIEKDEVTGKKETVPLVTGKLSRKLPQLFDEVYVFTTSESASGTNYRVLLQPSGYYKARTRMGGRGKLPEVIDDQPEFTRAVTGEDGEQYHYMDFKKIFSKFGKSAEDKSLFLEEESEEA